MESRFWGENARFPREASHDLHSKSVSVFVRLQQLGKRKNTVTFREKAHLEETEWRLVCGYGQGRHSVTVK
jgi:hypothetical protein